jgi:outer membrane protein OmpA-like peptidoglycan-associated protein
VKTLRHRAFWLSLGLFLAAGETHGAETLRAQSLSALDSPLKHHLSTTPLAAVSDLPPTGTVAVGKPLELKLTLSHPAYVNIVYLDSHGVLEVIQPDLGSAGNFASPGEHYVSGAAGQTWVARLPAGPAALYVLATAKSLQSLVSNTVEANRHFLVSAADAPAFAARMAKEIGAAPAGDVLEQRVDLQIESGSAQYSAGDIVRYFSETTRSVSRPRLDVYINFDFDSADIQSSSVRALDTWGRVLKDPLMSSQVFVIGGHTDDVGPPAYNQQLSVRRAEAVRAYLVSKHGISPQRLQVVGYGMTQPLVEGMDEAARMQNRRVDFERSDLSH